MSQPATNHHKQNLRRSASSNDNNQQQQQQQPPIIEIESDDDDDVLFLQTVQKSVPRLQPPPPLQCLVKTSGPLDYHEDCFCIKCRMIKEFLVNLPNMPKCANGTCVECDDRAVGGDQQHQPQAHNGDVVDGSNEVTHPQAPIGEPGNEQQNNEPQGVLSPPHDDDDRYSRCTTPDYLPSFFSEDDDDDDDDDDDEENEKDGDGEDAEVMETEEEKVDEEMNQSKSEDETDVDSSDYEPSPKKPTSSTSTNKKKKQKKASSSATKSSDCPLCKSVHCTRPHMIRHYRVSHLNWRPYFCKWTKCAFVSRSSFDVAKHVKSNHLNDTVNMHELSGKDYVGKRDDIPPTDTLLSAHLLKTTGVIYPVTTTVEPNTIPSENICHKCGRTFGHPRFLEPHLESHHSFGFKCIWPNCGYFFSNGKATAARKHVYHEHLGITGIKPSSTDMERAKQYLQPVSNSDNSAAKSTTNALATMVLGCSRCSREFNTEGHLAEHFRQEHTSKMLFRCAVSECTFSNLVHKDMLAHIRTKHHSEWNSGKRNVVARKYVEKLYLVPKRK